MSIPRDVIVIGAAEGSLPALRELLISLPASLAATVLIAMEALPEALQLKFVADYDGALPLIYAQEGDALELGRIYVTLPATEMVVRPSGLLGIDLLDPSHSQTSRINRMQFSVAKVLGFRAVSVLLSGNEGLGTEGLRAIEKADGIAIVQDPSEATASSMSVHAIQNDKPHYIAPIAGITSLLESLTEPQRDPNVKPTDKTVLD